MKNIKLIAVANLLCLIVACTNSGKGVISYPDISNMQTILVPNADEANIDDLDRLVDSVFVIKLKPFREHYIGVIDKVIFTKTRIVIFDYNSQAVFVYNYEGDCSSYFSLNGKGKNYKIWDIDVDEKEGVILVKDNFREKMMYFSMNGQMLKKNESTHYGFSFRKLNNKIFAFYGSFSKLYNDDQLCRLFYVTSDDEIIQKFFPYPKELQDKDLIELNDFFHRSNNKLMCIDGFTYSAYEVNEMGLSGKYRFDFANFNFPEGRYISIHDKDSTQIAILRYLYETETHIFFKYVIRTKKSFLSILDKRTGELYKKTILQNNENGLLTGDMVVGLHDDYLVQYIEPCVFTNYSKNTSELNNCLVKYGLADMQPSDNPVLVFTKFK